jgi:predicted nucleic acid-binding protein
LRYIVDTNVVSEVRKTSPDARVRAWWDAQAAHDLFITATIASELLLGVELLPRGRKRDELAAWTALVLSSTFADRILPFDASAAPVYARLVAQARRNGRTVGLGDAQIAAVALDRGLAVATRDVSDFSTFGVALIDPWA